MTGRTETIETELRGHASPPDSVGHSVEQSKVRLKLEANLFGCATSPITIGRFRLLDQIGAGGMGVVYSAYDPELDRKVAIKLIRASTRREEQLRFAEGKSLAKLSHPNVVHVHDVGIWRHYVYLVMEFVRGETLRVFASDPKRTCLSILSIYLQAGDGLAAAHDVGIIHGDFKPENAMVGEDGRVRVLDFGLASSTVLTRSNSQEQEEGARTMAVVAGTPKYMAPEQRTGMPASLFTDQFSFAVSLREALKEPLKKESTRKFAYLNAILDRATSEHYEDRFSTLQQMLDAINEVPKRSARRKRTVVFSTVGILSMALLSVRELTRVEDSEDRCHGGREALARAWATDDRKDRLEKLGRFAGLYGETAISMVNGLLDDYESQWEAAYRDACTENLRGAQSDNILDLRMACLGRRKERLSDLSSIASEIEASSLPDFVLAVRSLSNPQECSNLDELLQNKEELPPISIRADVEALSRRLEKANTTSTAGLFVEAQAEINEVITAARSLAYRPLLAQSLLSLGRTQIHLANPRLAIGPLEEATRLAFANGNYSLALESWARWAWASGTSSESNQDSDDGVQWILSIAEGLPNAEFERGLLFNNLGGVALARSQREEARKWFLQATEFVDYVQGPEKVELLYAMSNLALVTDDPILRETRFASGIEWFIELVGEDHPLTLGAEYLRGVNTLELEKARFRLGDVCSRYQQNHPNLSTAILNCWYQFSWRSFFAGDSVASRSAMEKVANCSACGEKEDYASGLVSLLSDDIQNSIFKFSEIVSRFSTKKSLPWWERRNKALAQMGVALAKQKLGKTAEALTDLDQVAFTVLGILETQPVFHQQILNFIEERQQELLADFPKKRTKYESMR